jgi:hypothetical protein
MPAPPPRLGVLVAAGALMASGAPLGAAHNFTPSGGGGGGGANGAGGVNGAANGAAAMGSDGSRLSSADRRFAASLLTNDLDRGRSLGGGGSGGGGGGGGGAQQQ